MSNNFVLKCWIRSSANFFPTHTSVVQFFCRQHLLFKCMMYVLCIQSLSCIQLFCDPMDCSPPSPQSMGFPRQEYWSGFLFPPAGDLPDPGIEPMSSASSALQAGSLLLSHLLTSALQIELHSSGKRAGGQCQGSSEDCTGIKWYKLIYQVMRENMRTLIYI